MPAGWEGWGRFNGARFLEHKGRRKDKSLLAGYDVFEEPVLGVRFATAI